MSRLREFWLLVFIPYGIAQFVNNAVCTDGSLNWAFNSLGESPCQVVVDLASTCYSSYSLGPLSPGAAYTPANSTEAQRLCNCNGVRYALTSACAACQGREWLSWSDWVSYCPPSDVQLQGFPFQLPQGARVPAWAYMDPAPSNGFNITAAQSHVDEPEIIGPSSIPITSSTTQGPTSTASSNSDLSGNKSSSARGVAIIGGTIAGIVIVALSATAVYFTIRRHRQQKRAELEWSKASNLPTLRPTPYEYVPENTRPSTIYAPSEFPHHRAMASTESSAPLLPSPSNWNLLDENFTTRFPANNDIISYSPDTRPTRLFASSTSSIITHQYRGIPEI